MLARARRRRLSPEARRAQLLGVARDLFAARPYDAVSMEDVSTAAGISKGLAFHYFESKRDLYVETVRVAAEALLAATVPHEELPPVERLEVSLDEYLEHVAGHSAAYRRFLSAGGAIDPEVVEIVDGVREVTVGRVLTGLKLQDVPPKVRIGLRGWVGFIERTSLAWLEDPQVPQSQIRKLLMANLGATLVATGAYKLHAFLAELVKMSV